MKIIFLSLSTYSIVGGIQTYNKKFIKALELNDIDYIVISLHDKKCNSQNIICCNSNIFLFIFYLFKYKSYADITIWGHVNLAPLVSLNKIFSTSKNVLITHGIEVWYPNLNLLKKYSLKLFNKIFTVSNYTKEKMITIQNVSKDKIDILPNSLVMLNEEGTQNPFNPKKFHILTVLRIDESDKLKSITNILDAMEKIGLDDIHFTIIGRGNKEEYIQNEINKRDLNKQVDMLGYVENLVPYLEHCDVFSLISDREGFGIVYLEAMAYKKPCLSAKNCGSSDVVVDDYNGYSILLDDIKDLTNKILDLKLDKIKRKQFGTNGYNLLIENFTYEQYIKKQKLLLESSI